MILFKALILGVTITGALFGIVAFVLWLLPVITFMTIFGIVSVVAYVLIQESLKPKEPPKGGSFYDYDPRD